MSRKRRRQAKNLIRKSDEKAGRKRLHLPALYIFALIFLATGIGTSLLFSLMPSFTDSFYTQKVYPFIRSVSGILPSLTKVSFTEVSIWLIFTGVLAFFILSAVRLLTGRMRLRHIAVFFAVTLFVASIVLNWFNIAGGINYRTVTMDKKLDLNIKERTVTQLYGFCVYLRGQANNIRSSVSENSDGIYYVDDIDKHLELTAQEVSRIEKINTAGVEVPAAKQFMLPGLMTKFGIMGIFMPFYAETNVNTEQPSLLILSSAAHENAHYLGIAREDEANFVAYLACISSDNSNIKYSGIMHALMYCSSRLYDADRDLYKELINGYDNRVRSDLKDYYAFWEETEGSLSDKISEAVNDAYLKYNGIKSGEQSYGETVDLMLAYYAKTNGE